MTKDSKFVEEEESSDDKRASDSEFSHESSDEESQDNEAFADVQTPPPALQPQDQEMGSPHESDRNSDNGENDSTEEVHDDDDDAEAEAEEEDEGYPQCFPANPPIVEILPIFNYPADAPRSSPSARNLDFRRTLQNNFVPFSKGMKGEAYRKRTTFEHQTVMGYVYI